MTTKKTAAKSIKAAPKTRAKKAAPSEKSKVTLKSKEDKPSAKKAPGIKIRHEGDGKFTLMSAVVDVNGVEGLAGSKVIVNATAKSTLAKDVGAVFTCSKVRYRDKGKSFYASGPFEMIQEEKPKASLYDVLMKAPKPPGFIIDNEKWTLLLRNILKGKHTVLVGPTGSGKTELVRHAAETVNYAYSYFNIGNSADPRSKLIGNVHLIKSEEGDYNITNFVESRFVKAIQTENMVILFDEINRSNPEVNNMCLTLLDTQGYLELDEHEGAGIVHKHPKCVIVGTANIGDEYVGTNILDRAFKDRVFMIEMDYLSSEEEKALIIERTEIDETNAQNIAEFADTCRKMWKKGELSTPVSTRMTLEAGFLIKDGFDFTQSITASILPFFENDGTPACDAMKVKQAMQKKG